MNARAKTHGLRSLRRAAALLPLALMLVLLSGCATASVYQREHLVDRIMSFDAEDKDQLRKMKALEAREGSTGGAGGAGGGCACN
jgi:predicted ATP-dependent serine protease